MGGEGGIQSEDRRLLPQYGRWYTRRLSLLTGIDYKLATLKEPIAAQTKRPPKTAKYNKSDRGTMDLFNCRLEGSFCRLDGVDAPRRHRCAKVVVLSNHHRGGVHGPG